MKKMIAAAAIMAMLILLGGLFLLPRTEDSSGLNGAAAQGIMLLDDEQGVYVLAVTDRSPADLAGVEPGDVLLSAGGIAIGKAQLLDEMLEAAQGPLVLQLLRDGEALEVQLPAR